MSNIKIPVLGYFLRQHYKEEFLQTLLPRLHFILIQKSEITINLLFNNFFCYFLTVSL